MKRYKWLVLTTMLLLAGVWLRGQLHQWHKGGRVMAAYGFASYVANEYMPAQRRLNKKWPTSLSDLPRVIKADNNYTPGGGGIESVALDYYNNGFRKIEMIENNNQDCVYRLYLKDYPPVDCWSTVNPDAGDCKF